MALQTISLSMMQFHPGPLMSDELDASQPGRACEIICDDTPVEIDMMLSLVTESNPIFLDDYREQLPARRAG